MTRHQTRMFKHVLTPTELELKEAVMRTQPAFHRMLRSG